LKLLVACFDFQAHYSNMGTQDEYRKRAAEAQRQADRTTSALDRESWLKIAQGWMSMLKKPKQTAQETFDQGVTDQGTGQDENKSSN
jgi:hypothetical protein